MACGKPCNCESYRAHLLSVGFAAAAMPSRKGTVAQTEAKERDLSKDLAAYKRLRNEGLQPAHVDGTHRIEQGAQHVAEVETGRLVSDFMVRD